MLKVETECEDDGRWIAELPALPGVMTYGATEQEAIAKMKVLAPRVIADRFENGAA
jgi:predicted RNase H-like HicB family nuclease